MTEEKTESLQAEIAKLRQENAKLKVATGAKLGLKVSTKGAVSMYNIGRFPITLYAEQWEKVLDKTDEVRAFINANRDKLTVKAAKVTAEATEEVTAEATEE